MKKILVIVLLVLIKQSLAFAQSCSTTGGELVDNGGFEQCTTCGNILQSGEYPDYSPTYSPSDCSKSGIGPGKFAITRDASLCYGSWVGAAQTPHSGNYAMLIDANTTTPNRVWCQDIPVTAGSTYQFSAWYQNAVNSSSSPGSIPSLQVSINGVAQGDPAVLEHNGGWDRNICLWQAPAGTTTATVCIEIYAPSSSGSDILLDDISFQRVTGGSCTAGSCTYTGPVLPVELTSFTVKRAGEDALLQWKTASEENAQYFYIEKSEDGQNYSQVGKLDASGWSSSPLNYQFYDMSFNSNSYYRLRVADIDGKYDYSDIQFLSKDEDYIWLVNGNSGEIEIWADVNTSASWSVSVYTLQGQEYFNEKIQVSAGENKIIRTLNGGNQTSKIVRITGEDGTVILSEIIVQ